MFNLNFFRRSSLRGTTLLAAPSKSYTFSRNYHVCIALPTSRRCALPILFWPWPPYTLLPRSCFTWMFFIDSHWWVPLCVQRPAKAMSVQQIIMHVLQCQHDLDVHLLFCVDHDLHITSSEVVFNLDCFLQSSLMGTTLCVAPSKSYAFSTNYHSCIEMPTWPRCASPILCWPWPSYNLLPRSCLTWIFFIDLHWGVPLCLQRPAKAISFQQMIMHVLHYQHHVDVHFLFCFDLDLHIPSFRGRVLTWMFFVDPHWWVPLRVQCPAKAMHFKQIIMHALQCQHDVDVHLLFCFDIDLHLICSQVHV